MPNDLPLLIDDIRLREAILHEATSGDPQRLAELIGQYYRNEPARAERTDRSHLYLHIGFLIGAIGKLGAPAATSRATVPIPPTTAHEGGLLIALELLRDEQLIRLQFGEAIVWIDLSADHARALARALQARADALDGVVPLRPPTRLQ